ncbi:TIGR04222 domain-containing membrane protein [Cupriavidus sp. YAF13]|uniref:TIGR04222 domain-containing membrane protein n=1 Tax=Cupriavidus sp. YAF13 TaxID=3233075 RepID=UPI003F8EBF47
MTLANPLNPFSWPGQAFLAFYVVFGLMVAFGLRRWLRAPWRYPATAPLGPLTADPYCVAYLRGGEGEAKRAVLFSLIDRGLLEISGIKLCTKGAVELARRPLERAALTTCRIPQPTRQLLENKPWPRQATVDYQSALRKAGLLTPDDDSKPAAYWCALALLLGVAGFKVVHALLHGHYNVWLLIILAGVFWVFLMPDPQRLTPAGERFLADQRVLFGSLRSRRLRPGGQDPDATWLAAVFGLEALPLAVFPYVRTLFPLGPLSVKDENQPDNSGGCSSACSSSSDSGDSGGGSGCGGCGGGGGD